MYKRNFLIGFITTASLFLFFKNIRLIPTQEATNSFEVFEDHHAPAQAINVNCINNTEIKASNNQRVIREVINNNEVQIRSLAMIANSSLTEHESQWLALQNGNVPHHLLDSLTDHNLQHILEKIISGEPSDTRTFLIRIISSLDDKNKFSAIEYLTLSFRDIDKHAAIKVTAKITDKAIKLEAASLILNNDLSNDSLLLLLNIISHDEMINSSPSLLWELQSLYDESSDTDTDIRLALIVAMSGNNMSGNNTVNDEAFLNITNLITNTPNINHFQKIDLLANWLKQVNPILTEEQSFFIKEQMNSLLDDRTENIETRMLALSVLKFLISENK